MEMKQTKLIKRERKLSHDLKALKATEGKKSISAIPKCHFFHLVHFLGRRKTMALSTMIFRDTKKATDRMLLKGHNGGKAVWKLPRSRDERCYLEVFWGTQNWGPWTSSGDLIRLRRKMGNIRCYHSATTNSERNKKKTRIKKPLTSCIIR